MSARVDNGPADTREFVQPSRYSYLYFGQPLVAVVLMLYVLALTEGIDVGLVLFSAAMALFTGVTGAWALLTAGRVVVTPDRLIAHTPLPVPIEIPLGSIRLLQLLNRGRLGSPARVLRVVSQNPRRELFVTDAMIGFDQLVSELRSRAGHVEATPLSRWERIWLFQWGL